MTNAPERVIELPSARMPADGGASTLALLVQLAGTVFALGAAALALLLLFTRAATGSAILLLSLSALRSLVHRRVGTVILYEPLKDPLESIRRYVAIGLAHSVLVAAVLYAHRGFGITGAHAVACGVALALWPLALWAIAARGKLCSFSKNSEDNGFEAASIVMAVFGACGALAIIVQLWLVSTVASLRGWGHVNFALLLVLGPLLIRSGIHFRAGMAGLRETSSDRAVERTNAYTNFSLSTMTYLGLGLLALALIHGKWHGAATAPLVIVPIALCALLAAWPFIIRSFFRDRQFAELLAGDRAAQHRRAPDAGLTGLGWLLVGHAALTAALLVPQLAGATPLELVGTALPSYDFGGTRSLWWTAGISVLEAWAGYELVRMSPQHRRVSIGYGAVAIAVMLYLASGADEIRFLQQPELLVPAVCQLVFAAATLLLVGRNVTPAARARYVTMTR